MELMFELFPRLEERRRQAAGTMSGGERQMVAMGRALMPDPQILLLDEPSAGLAPAFVDAIFEKVVEVNKAGVTILMVEQNARRALELSDRGYVLDLGQNKFKGPGPELIRDPKVADLYLGGGTGRVDAAPGVTGSTEKRAPGRRGDRGLSSTWLGRVRLTRPPTSRPCRSPRTRPCRRTRRRRRTRATGSPFSSRSIGPETPSKSMSSPACSASTASAIWV